MSLSKPSPPYKACLTVCPDVPDDRGVGRLRGDRLRRDVRLRPGVQCSAGHHGCCVPGWAVRFAVPAPFPLSLLRGRVFLPACLGASALPGRLSRPPQLSPGLFFLSPVPERRLLSGISPAAG